jgi:prepilin-type N-terminal cleavage/methylation domain-containing protein/prepilin-type processing-associated H-X9-DG protein
MCGNGRISSTQRRAFTLVELLVVIGIIAVLIGILLPTLSKARKSARTTVCLSNLRQMGTAWVMYLSDTKGRLPYSVWHQQPPGFTGARYNDFVWHGYWFGILNDYRVGPGQMLCPEASAPAIADYEALYAPPGIKGGGSAFEAWSGKFQTASPVGIMIDQTKQNNTADATKGGYRIGSYGFNGNLFFSPGPDGNYGTTAAAGQGSDDGIRTPSSPPLPTAVSKAFWGANIAQVKPSSEVPAFYDCVWIDNQGMVNGTPTQQPTPPTDLFGARSPKNSGSGDNNHWRILIARHGRGINMCYADGHAAWVQLEDTYQQKWTPYWRKYSLNNLPRS